MGQQRFDRFFRVAPPEVDVDTIQREWLALQSSGARDGGPAAGIADRQLPLPVWGRRSFTENGSQAWQTLCRNVPTIEAGRPFCIYVHIPFCPERCHFCDCYSFRLASNRAQQIDSYLTRLGQEMRLWGRLGSLASRPVSTVHLGGGTPTWLGEEAIAQLVYLCQEHFAAEPETEWALESTASELSPAMLGHLHGLGFTRLHVGVQTLQDDVRPALNRRATADAVLETIARAVAMGWIVSVDLIYGLPDQTLDSLLGDIRRLSAMGINGFSLYELQLSTRNRAFTQRHRLQERDRELNYFLAQAASHLLVELGFEKTLFNHFADRRDTNLYFTFPARGEDCLALGTIADGSFGDYHYRHLEYAAYRRSVGQCAGLQGGLRRNQVENQLQPLSIGLLAGRVPQSLFASPASQSLLTSWQALRLLVEDRQTGDLRLTGNGSWLVGNMLAQLMAAHMAIKGAESGVF